MYNSIYEKSSLCNKYFHIYSDGTDAKLSVFVIIQSEIKVIFRCARMILRSSYVLQSSGWFGASSQIHTLRFFFFFLSKKTRTRIIDSYSSDLSSFDQRVGLHCCTQPTRSTKTNRQRFFEKVFLRNKKNDNRIDKKGNW